MECTPSAPGRSSVVDPSASVRQSVGRAVKRSASVPLLVTVTVVRPNAPGDALNSATSGCTVIETAAEAAVRRLTAHARAATRPTQERPLVCIDQVALTTTVKPLPV